MQIGTQQFSPDAKSVGIQTQVEQDRPTASLRIIAADSNSPHNTIVRELAAKFLDWQCRMIAGVMRGALYPVDANGALGEAHDVWPDGVASADVLPHVAAKASASASSELASKITYTQNKGQVCDAVACPIIHNGEVVAVVAFALATRAMPQQKAVLQLIEWGANWFATLLEREVSSQKQRAPLLFELLSTAMQQSSIEQLATDVVELLVKREVCDRASIAVSNKNRMKLRAVSGIENFDARTRFATRIEEAIEESADQDMPIEFPSADKELIDRVHQRLGDVNPNTRFFTIHAEHNNTRLGLVIERKREAEYSIGDRELFVQVAQTLVEAVALINAANSSVSAWIGRTRQQLEQRLFGRAGLWTLLIAAAIFASAYIPSTHRVSAQAELISQEQRAVVASIDGYIASSQVRPGDDVIEGELLATLDTRELKLEADKWRSLRGARQVEYQDALAKRDRSQVSVLRARLDQIDAELALVNAKLVRADMRAPYNGVIVRGDLSQALDAPVEQGQVLFEIAPLTGYRVVIEVSEYDIADVSVGNEGHLRLSSMPRAQLPFTVQRIMPVAESGDGFSFFRVEAHIEEIPPALRPGMRGVAKIYVGEKTVLWRASHAVVDRVRLFFWSLGF